MSRLEPGSPAPTFDLPDADGRRVKLSDYAGRRVIVYFFPAAMTPGCTIQAIDFSDSLADLADAGVDVVGISPDSVATLAKFREADSLRITLLADPVRATLEAYGTWGTKMLYGKEIVGVIRSTFVIDVDDTGRGTVALAKYNVKATGHVATLRRELGV